MAAGGYKEFVAGETLDQDEINDYLMQGMLVFAGTAARGSAITSPVEGQFTFLTDTDAVEFYDGSQWVALETETPYAVVSGTSGSATLGTVVSGGTTYNVYEFTGDGSITFSEAGVVDLLVLGGGSGGGYGGSDNAGGGGGAGSYVRLDKSFVTASTVTVTVGAGGAGQPSNTFSVYGGASAFGSIEAMRGGAGGHQGAAAQIAFTGSGKFGGSGGGGHSSSDGAGMLQGGSMPSTGNDGGAGNPSGTSAQNTGGGGGGAGAAGVAGTNSAGGDGGAGLSSDITGTSLFYAGGGGGGKRSTAPAGSGGSSIGGDGGVNAAGSAASPANRGSGGGGGANNNAGGAGSSGVVIVRVAV